MLQHQHLLQQLHQQQKICIKNNPYQHFFERVNKYNTQAHFNPTILNVKRGVWHALVRTASQLHLTNTLANKNDESNSHKWNIGWVDKASMVFYRTLSRFQKVNHLLGVEQICRKRNLARIAQHVLHQTDAHKRDDYDFLPRSWILPRDVDVLRTYMTDKIEKAKAAGQEPPAYIIKPGSSCQGRGIYLAQSLDQIEVQNGYVVQEYIHNPLTILGRKFDLRIYVLHTSTSPLRLYMYEDGLARFSTKQYVKPNANNIAELFTHLTNFSLNKLNKEDFVDSGNSDNDADEFNPRNNKWSLLQFNDYVFKTFGPKRYNEMWHGINDIIIKTILSAAPIMNEAYNTLLNEMTSENNVNFDNRAAGFQLYGFDIMFDENFKPWLIEVNRNPSLRCEASIDEYIKTQLLGQLAMILDPVTSLTPTNHTICHMAKSIYGILKKEPEYKTIFTHISPQFKQIYSKLVKTADAEKVQTGTPTTITPFFTTLVEDDTFWLELVKDDTVYTTEPQKQLLILFLQSIFDVERIAAKQLYTGALLSFWLHHKSKYELQCRLYHEDRVIDALHQNTLHWHSLNPTPYDLKLAETQKQVQKEKGNIVQLPDGIPSSIGNALIGGYYPLLFQSPNYRKNGLSKLVMKHKPAGQPTEAIRILRDFETNIPIYASNFRTIYPLEPLSDYPYPYAEEELPKHIVDLQIDLLKAA
eukprot:UN02095